MRPPIGAKKPGETFQQRRLAAAVGAADGEQFAPGAMTPER